MNGANELRSDLIYSSAQKRESEMQSCFSESASDAYKNCSETINERKKSLRSFDCSKGQKSPSEKVSSKRMAGECELGKTTTKTDVREKRKVFLKVDRSLRQRGHKTVLLNDNSMSNDVKKHGSGPSEKSLTSFRIISIVNEHEEQSENDVEVDNTDMRPMDVEKCKFETKEDSEISKMPYEDNCRAGKYVLCKESANCGNGRGVNDARGDSHEKKTEVRVRKKRQVKLADNSEVKRKKYNNDEETLLLVSELSMAGQCDLEFKSLNIKRSSCLQKLFFLESSNACANDLQKMDSCMMENQNSDEDKETEDLVGLGDGHRLIGTIIPVSGPLFNSLDVTNDQEFDSQSCFLGRGEEIEFMEADTDCKDDTEIFENDVKCNSLCGSQEWGGNQTGEGDISIGEGDLVKVECAHLVQNSVEDNIQLHQVHPDVGGSIVLGGHCFEDPSLDTSSGMFRMMKTDDIKLCADKQELNSEQDADSDAMNVCMMKSELTICDNQEIVNSKDYTNKIHHENVVSSPPKGNIKMCCTEDMNLHQVNSGHDYDTSLPYQMEISGTEHYDVTCLPDVPAVHCCTVALEKSPDCTDMQSEVHTGLAVHDVCPSCDNNVTTSTTESSSQWRKSPTNLNCCSQFNAPISFDLPVCFAMVPFISFPIASSGSARQHFDNGNVTRGNGGYHPLGHLLEIPVVLRTTCDVVVSLKPRQHDQPAANGDSMRKETVGDCDRCSLIEISADLSEANVQCCQEPIDSCCLVDSSDSTLEAKAPCHPQERLCPFSPARILSNSSDAVVNCHPQEHLKSCYVTDTLDVKYPSSKPDSFDQNIEGDPVYSFSDDFYVEEVCCSQDSEVALELAVNFQTVSSSGLCNVSENTMVSVKGEKVLLKEDNGFATSRDHTKSLEFYQNTDACVLKDTWVTESRSKSETVLVEHCYCNSQASDECEINTLESICSEDHVNKAADIASSNQDICYTQLITGGAEFSDCKDDKFLQSSSELNELDEVHYVVLSPLAQTDNNFNKDPGYSNILMPKRNFNDSDNGQNRGSFSNIMLQTDECKLSEPTCLPSKKNSDMGFLNFLSFEKSSLILESNFAASESGMEVACEEVVETAASYVKEALCASSISSLDIRKLPEVNSTSGTLLCNPECLSAVDNGSSELIRDAVCEQECEGANIINTTGSEMTFECRSDDSVTYLSSIDLAPCSASKDTSLMNNNERRNVDCSNIVSTDPRTNCGTAPEGDGDCVSAGTKMVAGLFHPEIKPKGRKGRKGQKGQKVQISKQKQKQRVIAPNDSEDDPGHLFRKSMLGLRLSPRKVSRLGYDGNVSQNKEESSQEKLCQDQTLNDTSNIPLQLPIEPLKSKKRNLKGNVQCSLGIPPGSLVWARLGCQKYWPAIVVDSQRLTHKAVKASHSWVFWFGDHKISEVPRVNLISFVGCFCDKYSSSTRRLFQAGISEAIKEQFRRDKRNVGAYDDHSTADLINLAIEAFQGRSELPRETGHMMPSWIEEKLKKIELPLLRQKSKKQEGDAISAATGAQNSAVDIHPKSSTDVCIGCDHALTDPSYQHPFFEGRLCSVCRARLLETIFCFDSDGTNGYCIICGSGDKVLVCDVSGCNKVFCVDCVARLAGVDICNAIEKCDNWACFLCTSYDSQKHGLLKGRTDWRTQIALLFQHTGKYTLPAAIANRRPIRVLSLFDGIGTGFLVLDQLNIEVEAYFASEVDQDAITVAQIRNAGRIKQLGDVCSIDVVMLGKLGHIDLLIGGSPCNELSVANPTRKGLEAGTGRLFYEFLRILMYLKSANQDSPLFWLYENVATMTEESKSTISRMFTCEPALWDAKHFTAQRRARYFWGNIPEMYCPLQYSSKESAGNLDDSLFPTRKAKTQKIRTITTQRNSLLMDRNKDDSYPVTMGNNDDGLWIPEVERIFGFPEHYTDVANLSASRRQKLLGQSWSVPVIKHLLSPLRSYFQTKGTNQSLPANAAASPLQDNVTGTSSGLH